MNSFERTSLDSGMQGMSLRESLDKAKGEAVIILESSNAPNIHFSGEVGASEEAFLSDWDEDETVELHG